MNRAEESFDTRHIACNIFSQLACGAGDLFRYWALYADDRDSDKLERREQHLSYAGRYKGTDSFSVLNPWLVTPDEAGDPDELQVTCTVGGEIAALDSTRFYNYQVEEIINGIKGLNTTAIADCFSPYWF
jgi:hypothetical protein